MTRPLLIFGQNGQLARALARSARARGLDVQMIGSAQCDLAETPTACAAHVSGARAVINASAYTKVDAAEDNHAVNRALNASAPGAMAAACARHAIPFIHISTDYVFDGRATAPLSPDTPLAPLNAYGRAKAAGERAVTAAGGQSLILRTSWVYDGTGANFLTTMLRLAERGELRIVDDQVGRPTYAGHLAEAILAAIDHGWTGQLIEHVQDTGPAISWADFAAAIFRSAGERVSIQPIPSSEYPTPALRPDYSVLDVRGFETRFDHPLMDWRSGLELALWERSRI